MRYKIRRHLSLIRAHFGLLSISALVLLLVRVAQYFTSYQKLAGLIVVRPQSGALEKPVLLIVWAVARVSTIVPKANCLTRALALQYLLGRYGHESIIRIGVADGPPKGFEAHAWVLYRNEAIIGHLNEDITRFTPITDLRPRYL
jgi:hypothetical protein